MNHAHRTPANPHIWRAPDGSPVACVEKIKVLNENFAELQQLALDTLEDGLLMGCAEEQLRQAMVDMILSLESTFSPAGKKSGTQSR
ncbi:MAG: hypothetical protein HYU74_11620 [Dechloromonas sp.]|nr:hypothetical protein [Dechloromonas sp.]